MMSTSEQPSRIALLGSEVDRATQPLADWSQWNPAQHAVLLLNLPADEQDRVLQAVRRDPDRYLHWRMVCWSSWMNGCLTCLSVWPC